MFSYTATGQLKIQKNNLIEGFNTIEGNNTIKNSDTIEGFDIEKISSHKSQLFQKYTLTGEYINRRVTGRKRRNLSSSSFHSTSSVAI